MRMKTRIRLFVISYFSGVMLWAPLLDQIGWNKYLTPFFVCWFMFFAILQFFVFKCPHCGKLAIFTPRWMATPFVGDNCRYCGAEY